jgi:hypothetical protein
VPQGQDYVLLEFLAPTQNQANDLGINEVKISHKVSTGRGQLNGIDQQSTITAVHQDLPRYIQDLLNENGQE